MNKSTLELLDIMDDLSVMEESVYIEGEII